MISQKNDFVVIFWKLFGIYYDFGNYEMFTIHLLRRYFIINLIKKRMYRVYSLKKYQVIFVREFHYVRVKIIFDVK